jgi:hemerythrin
MCFTAQCVVPSVPFRWSPARSREWPKEREEIFHSNFWSAQMNAKFQWLDEYKIGDAAIDKQHEYLFDLANQIVDPDNDQQKTYHNIMALYHYVKEHFKAEEAIMKLRKYVDYDEHIKEHVLLSKRLDEISSQVIRGDTGPDEVMRFMRSWLLEHILGRDVLLGDFLHHKQECVGHEEAKVFAHA